MHPSTHPTAAIFESWISGSLQGDAADRFEAHVAACGDCGQRVFEAAKEERFLSEVAAAAAEAPAMPYSVAPEATAPAPANRPWARRLAPLVAIVALAATALLFVQPPPSSPLPEYGALSVTGQATVRSADAPDATTTLAGGYQLLLRPAVATDAPLQARVFLVEAGALVPLSPRVEVASTTGAVRVTERAIAGSPLASVGDKRLVVAVGAVGTELSAEAMRAAAGGATAADGWSFHPGTLRVEATAP